MINRHPNGFSIWLRIHVRRRWFVLRYFNRGSSRRFACGVYNSRDFAYGPFSRRWRS